jgi:glycosyltransferase involved in cell wall biosynthesis
VLVEALVCGTPVISTDCPSGPAEILEFGRHGRLVPVEEPAAMAQAILATIASPPDRTLLRTRADSFTVDRAADLYLSLLRAGCS